MQRKQKRFMVRYLEWGKEYKRKAESLINVKISPLKLKITATLS